MQPTRLMSHDSNIRILSWNARFTDKIGWFDEGEFDRCGQMERRCIYSTNYLVYNQSDVILLDSFYLRFDQFPKYRLPGQKWVFNGYESPDRKSWPNYGVYDSWYNLTMTFTKDSDIFTPYGICVDTNVSASHQNQHVKIIYGNQEQPYLNAAQKIIKSYRNSLNNVNGQLPIKPGGAMWLVSHCNTESKRELYVNTLMKYTRVSIYGRCGKGILPLNKEKQMLTKIYKFYLAFENSLCDEYTTEKLFKVLSQPIVPIVLGNVDYTNILPPHSFIDIKKYKSAAHLGRYLNYLSRTPRAYAKYFDWKKRYACFNRIPFPSLACRMCKYLNDNYSKINSVKSISEFWSKETRCKSVKNYYNNINDLI